MCGITLLFLVIYSLWIEYKQFFSNPEGQRSDYFLDFANWFDIAGLLLTLLITVLTLTKRDWISLEYLRCIASFASINLVLKCYNWLQLFEDTAFYAALVGITLSDIKSFMILYFVSLLGFALPMIMLDFNREEESRVVQGSTFGWSVLDAVYNQYLLSLGEFVSLD